jgi:hypothetical protein
MKTFEPPSSVRTGDRRGQAAWLVPFVLLAGVLLAPAWSSAQITAAARPGATPPWDKGMIPINAESYYHAIECGKQGGDDPPCVFWDTGVCRNDDFTLAFYSGYKQVAYAVWTAARAKKPAPQPSYQAAQRTRVTIGVTPAAGGKNPFTDLVLKRGGKTVPPVDRSVGDRSGRFTFDYSAWAPILKTAAGTRAERERKMPAAWAART